MKIFDDIPRSDMGRKNNVESYFAYYNRSARTEIQRVRELLEICISQYPSDEVDEIVTRIRSGNDVHFKSSSFELFLHESLIRLGCKLTPHPALSNDSSSRPDFLVTTPEGEEFYLEAVLASQINELNDGAESRKGLVIDTLSNNPHHNFMIIIDDEGNPTSQPSGKKLVKEIHGWLDSLDTDEIREIIDLNGLEAVKPYKWKHEEWAVTFTPVPLKPERRGKSTNLIGAGPIVSGFIDEWSPIRNAVKHKGTKYGELDKSLLIAVNINSSHLDRIDEMQALYGQEQFVIEGGNTGKEPRMERMPNGAWHGKGGAQYTRVSGVWIFHDLRPTTIAQTGQTIYFNPWSTYPLPAILKAFPHAVPENQQMVWVDGTSIADLFGLGNEWPG